MSVIVFTCFCAAALSCLRVKAFFSRNCHNLTLSISVSTILSIRQKGTGMLHLQYIYFQHNLIFLDYLTVSNEIVPYDERRVQNFDCPSLCVSWLLENFRKMIISFLENRQTNMAFWLLGLPFSSAPDCSLNL